MTKVDRYKWTVKDAPGTFTLIPKELLVVNHEYQRDLKKNKTQGMASNWSWISCSAICVAVRNGIFYVIDGQHRVEAAKKREDIDKLPCMVFDVQSVSDEANGFLSTNLNRQAMSSIDRFRAMIVAGDLDAVFVDSVFNRFGLVPSYSCARHGEIKCVGLSMKLSVIDRDAFVLALETSLHLCPDSAVNEILLDGLFYIHKNAADMDLNNKWLRTRLFSVGAPTLITGAKRASAYFAKGGAKIWAMGMADAVNKGTKIKLAFK